MTRLVMCQLHQSFQLHRSYHGYLPAPKCCPHYRLSLYSIGFHSVPRIPVCQRNIGSFLLPPKLDVDSEEVTEQQSSCFPVIATIPHGYDTRNPLCLEAYDQVCSQQNVIYPSISIFRKSIQNQISLNLFFHCKVWGSVIPCMVHSVQQTLSQLLLDFLPHPFFLQPFLFILFFILSEYCLRTETYGWYKQKVFFQKSVFCCCS